jgi:hypothetical protein
MRFLIEKCAWGIVSLLLSTSAIAHTDTLVISYCLDQNPANSMRLNCNGIILAVPSAGGGSGRVEENYDSLKHTLPENVTTCNIEVFGLHNFLKTSYPFPNGQPKMMIDLRTPNVVQATPLPAPPLPISISGFFTNSQGQPLTEKLDFMPNKSRDDMIYYKDNTCPFNKPRP